MLKKTKTTLESRYFVNHSYPQPLNQNWGTNVHRSNFRRVGTLQYDWHTLRYFWTK